MVLNQTYDVFQGSVLAPLLFVIYINNLNKLRENRILLNVAKTEKIISQSEKTTITKK